jgi:hypothetical protein
MTYGSRRISVWFAGALTLALAVLIPIATHAQKRPYFHAFMTADVFVTQPDGSQTGMKYVSTLTPYDPATTNLPRMKEENLKRLEKTLSAKHGDGFEVRQVALHSDASAQEAAKTRRKMLQDSDFAQFVEFSLAQ